jgi:hypothetical protein
VIRKTARRARQHHWCDGCRRYIQPGELYLECWASPNHHDLANPKWWRLAKCEPCAATHLDDHLIIRRDLIGPKAATEVRCR